MWVVSRCGFKRTYTGRPDCDHAASEGAGTRNRLKGLRRHGIPLGVHHVLGQGVDTHWLKGTGTHVQCHKGTLDARGVELLK